MAASTVANNLRLQDDPSMSSCIKRISGPVVAVANKFNEPLGGPEIVVPI